MNRSIFISKSALVTLGLLAVAQVSRGAFTPIAVDPASFNHDVVVEATAPLSINDFVNATQDGGTNKSGNTWYERGYNTAAPTTGLPPAGSTVTSGNRTFQMAPDYHTNCVIMVGHNNGSRTVVLPTGRLKLTTPAAYGGLTVLTCSGNGPVTVGYNINYADGTQDPGVFIALDWFNAAANVFNAAGRVTMAGGVQNVNGNPAGAVFLPTSPATPTLTLPTLSSFIPAPEPGTTRTTTAGQLSLP